MLPIVKHAVQVGRGNSSRRAPARSSSSVAPAASVRIEASVKASPRMILLVETDERHGGLQISSFVASLRAWHQKQLERQVSDPDHARALDVFKEALEHRRRFIQYIGQKKQYRNMSVRLCLRQMFPRSANAMVEANEKGPEKVEPTDGKVVNADEHDKTERQKERHRKTAVGMCIPEKHREFIESLTPISDVSGFIFDSSKHDTVEAELESELVMLHEGLTCASTKWVEAAVIDSEGHIVLQREDGAAIPTYKMSAQLQDVTPSMLFDDVSIHPAAKRETCTHFYPILSYPILSYPILSYILSFLTGAV